ncbi:MAG: glycerol-3-phosphate dehydrogenase, partial [Desulfuromonadales bacterium]|nr:glycerol-3-phosphate dehydrogenase [Desulfuromonadales bacterium]
RGLAEITRLGIALGAKGETFSGLAGMGDLVLTCTGDLSRNRTVGVKIGQGMDMQRVVSEMRMVAEGVKTTESTFMLAKRFNIEMPITAQVYEILYKNKLAKKAVMELMTREVKPEGI